MFTTNFWTHDYISGINTLIQQLEVNAADNKHVLEFLNARIVAERDYSSLLSFSRQISLPHQVKPSLEQFSSAIHRNTQQSQLHLRVSDEIDKQCYEPLANTTKLYNKNLKNAQELLKRQYNAYNKLRQQSTKLKSVELPQQSEAPKPLDSAMSTLRLFRGSPSTPNLQPLLEGHIVLAGIKYRGQDALALLSRLVKGLKMSEYRVPLIGTYENVSTGAAIASASRRHLKNDSIAYSDKFGQSLVDNGLLKPVAQISNKFQNSNQSFYQWQPALLDLLNQNQPPVVTLSPPPQPERSVSPGLAQSEAYLQSILELDLYRCNLEQEIFNVYSFLEKCELERISAVHKALTNYKEITSPQSSPEPHFSPEQELREFVRRFRCGPFVPNVAIYRSNNGAVCQTFGVELEKTEFFTETLLNQLPQDLPLEYWTTPYSIEDAYKLRSQVNTGRTFNETIFRFFSSSTIVATLLQYYLELPESLIPFTVYDLAKDAAPQTVIQAIKGVHYNVLRTLLGFLRSRYEDYNLLGQSLAHYLFRPRAVSALTMDDQHPGRLIAALLKNFDEVFAEGPSTPSSSSFTSPQLTSPRPASRLEVVQQGGRPRASSSGSAFETSNGTSLIPLTLSPDSGKSQGPRLEMRHGLKLSGVLPIRTGQSPHNSPSRSRASSSVSGLGVGLASPIPLKERWQSTPSTPEVNEEKSEKDKSESEPSPKIEVCEPKKVESGAHEAKKVPNEDTTPDKTSASVQQDTEPAESNNS